MVAMMGGQMPPDDGEGGERPDQQWTQEDCDDDEKQKQIDLSEQA